MKKLDLTKVLKNAPKGTILYSTIHGEVMFNRIDMTDKTYPISVKTDKDVIYNFTADGRYYNNYHGECTLFPSKEIRDWDDISFERNILEVGNFIQIGNTVYMIGSINITCDIAIITLTAVCHKSLEHIEIYKIDNLNELHNVHLFFK